MSRLLLTLLVVMISSSACSAAIIPNIGGVFGVFSALTDLADVLFRLVPNIANLGLTQIPQECLDTLVKNLVAIVTGTNSLIPGVTDLARAALGTLLGLLGGVAGSV